MVIFEKCMSFDTHAQVKVKSVLITSVMTSYKNNFHCYCILMLIDAEKSDKLV